MENFLSLHDRHLSCTVDQHFLFSLTSTYGKTVQVRHVQQTE